MNRPTLIRKLARLLLLGAIVPAAASATVITFDPLTGAHLGPYSEAGFTFTMSGGSTPHFGDGFNLPGTLNWHDGGANDIGVVVSLTGGGTFDLTSFDLVSLSGPLTVSATGFGPITLGTAGTQVLDWTGLTSVAFDVGSRIAIDNVTLNETAVPEPGTLGLLGAGLLVVAAYMRRRKRAQFVRACRFDRYDI